MKREIITSKKIIMLAIEYDEEIDTFRIRSQNPNNTPYDEEITIWFSNLEAILIFNFLKKYL